MTSPGYGQRLLYFLPASRGGLADYAREQANALAHMGVKVELLSPDNFPVRTGDAFQLRPELKDRRAGRWGSSLYLASAQTILADHLKLARVVEAENYTHVLFGAYAEYLAPWWARRLLRLAEHGVVFGAVVHDPVRDYVVGPQWWHRRSIASAYSFLREAFVHEPLTLNTIRPMPHLRTTVIPHGVLTFPAPTATRDQFRRELGIADSAQVWLSFGHIRDGKNLDLVIRALARFPNAFLVVAGKEQSGGQKPVEFYRELARQRGVAERCLWLNRFIAPEEVANLFTASDIVLLTYSKDFRSASGVLNAAINFRKPCLASSGQGNLQTMVSQYDLGIWVEPDNVEALIEGLQRWQSLALVPRWKEYEADNSWPRNAQIVMDRMFGSVQS
ncbi:MAG TPA: glycosyltransferase family 4 protein [Candidatus Methylacidiphilales bacterium]